MTFVRKHLVTIVIGASLALAAASGVLVSQALGGAKAQTPTQTVTIDVGTGQTGPAGATGPAGPAGEPGAESCPSGSAFGEIVINSPGGHTRFLTCIVG